MSWKRILATIVVSILILGATAYTFQSYAAPDEAPRPARPGPQTASQVIQADGVVTPVRSVALKFNLAGRVAGVNVTEGATVKQGSVLAWLDDSVLKKQLTQAQTALELAQKQLEQLQAGATAEQIEVAQTALDAAEQNYDRIKQGPTVAQIAPLKANLDNAQAALRQAQTAYDHIGGATNPTIGQSPESRQLQEATNTYHGALSAYVEAISHPTEAELATATAQVRQAQEALDSLTPTPQALELAQAQVDNAQAAFDLLAAQEADYVLRAPFDGTIATKSIEVGQLVQPGTAAFIVGDLSQLQIEMTGLSAASAVRIKLGAPVTITSAGLPGQTFNGTVTQISPLADDRPGSELFQVSIALTPGEMPELKWGMPAHVELAGN